MFNEDFALAFVKEVLNTTQKPFFVFRIPEVAEVSTIAKEQHLVAHCLQ